jgi:RimK family alpha-L-glutamate ligase
MKFYCIIRNIDKRPKKTMQFFEEAARERSVELVVIESEKVQPHQLPTLSSGDLLYMAHHDATSKAIETLLLKGSPTTLYQNDTIGYYAWENVWTWTLLHDKKGLPIIPTIFDLPRNREALQEAVNELGGFPVVVKAEGGSHGVGVMIFDSMPSLASVVDYLRSSQPNQMFIMRKYIDYTTHARLIVLGNEVIDSIEYKRENNDFRSNTAKQPSVVAKKFSADIERAAIESVQALQLDFGGVDILIQEDGQFYIAEVNFPCNFSRSQITTGVDIAGAIIDLLKTKSLSRSEE